MAGGDPTTFETVDPIMAHYAQSRVLIGPTGAGQQAKMVNQMCIAGLVQGLAEGLAFARRAGLDGDKLLAAISKGAAQSWQMDNRAKSMLAGEYAFGFSVDWMRKDLAIALDEGRRIGARQPVTALVDQLYAAVQERGGGRWDTSSLMLPLDRVSSAPDKTS